MTRRLLALSVVALIAGLALAGVIAWQLWGTDLVTAQAQRQASAELDRRWSDAAPAPVVVGTPIARLTIPRFGAGWSRVLLEGVDEGTLARGPGHYPDTGTLGRPGNYAIAGHRVGQGAPFDGAADLVPCDPIVVTAAEATYTYRVLPYGNLPVPCTLRTVSGVPGQQIVTPDDVSVINARDDVALLTITTCHPRFSARQRLIIHAVLVSPVVAPFPALG